MSAKKVTIESQYKKYPKVWPKFVIIFVAVVLFYILCKITLEYKGVNERGLLIVKDALVGLLQPNLKYMTNLSKSGLLYMLLETLAIAFLGTVIGVVISLPLAFLAARNVCPKWLNLIVQVLISVLRAYPAFMLGIMFVKSVGPGAFAGVLSMAIGSIGMLSKLITEAIEDLNPGIGEALDAAGCSTFEKIRYGIIPQLASNMISIILYRLDINVKNATILGVVQAGGIGAQLMFAISAKRWHDTSAMLIGIIVLVLIIEYISTKIRSSLSSKN